MMEKALLDFVSRVQAQNLGVEAIAVATPDDIIFEHHFVRCAARNIYSTVKASPAQLSAWPLAMVCFLWTTVRLISSQKACLPTLTLAGRRLPFGIA